MENLKNSQISLNERALISLTSCPCIKCIDVSMERAEIDGIPEVPRRMSGRISRRIIPDGYPDAITTHSVTAVWAAWEDVTAWADMPTDTVTTKRKDRLMGEMEGMMGITFLRKRSTQFRKHWTHSVRNDPESNNITKPLTVPFRFRGFVLIMGLNDTCFMGLSWTYERRWDDERHSAWLSLLAGAVVGFCFGEMTGLFKALIFMMAVDYVTGWIKGDLYEAAIQFNGFQGDRKKIMILCLVSICHIIDVHVIGDKSIHHVGGIDVLHRQWGNIYWKRCYDRHSRCRMCLKKGIETAYWKRKKGKWRKQGGIMMKWEEIVRIAKAILERKSRDEVGCAGLCVVRCVGQSVLNRAGVGEGVTSTSCTMMQRMSQNSMVWTDWFSEAGRYSFLTGIQ